MFQPHAVCRRLQQVSRRWQSTDAAPTAPPTPKLKIWGFVATAAVFTLGVGSMFFSVVQHRRLRKAAEDALQHTQPVEGNPVVFLDLECPSGPLGRVVFELRSDVVPITAENFRVLVSGELGFGYRRVPFHWIDHTRMIGGDYVYGNGDFNASIYGAPFADENFELKHTWPGTLSMVSNGPNQNGCVFQLSLAPLPEEDGRSVAFGRVLEGMDVIWKIVDMQTKHKNRVNSQLWAFSRLPPPEVVISNCGQLGWIGEPRPKPRTPKIRPIPPWSSKLSVYSRGAPRLPNPTIEDEEATSWEEELRALLPPPHAVDATVLPPHTAKNGEATETPEQPAAPETPLATTTTATENAAPVASTTRVYEEYPDKPT